MNQTALELDTPAPTSADAAGMAIGWDHARHGLVPAAQLLLAGSAVGQGWMAGKAVFGRRTRTAGAHTRQWLQLRLQAWQQGMTFDLNHVTPRELGLIQVARCPVRRCALGGAGGDAAVVERLDPQAGYVAGKLVVLSAQAAAALREVGVRQARRHARMAEHGAPSVDGLDAPAWWRLATLRSFAAPLPFAEAAALPLAVLPPPHVRPLNGVQDLQVRLTQMFLAPGWSVRCRVFASWLPEHSLRHDFNLFVGAVAPRALEAGGRPAELARSLEDAWLLERVQRRWQHLALSLGESACDALLARCTGARRAGAAA